VLSLFLSYRDLSLRSRFQKMLGIQNKPKAQKNTEGFSSVPQVISSYRDLSLRSKFQRKLYWPRLAGGTMPFMRRYSIIWPYSSAAWITQALAI
jgi:hypothetical protein